MSKKCGATRYYTHRIRLEKLKQRAQLLDFLAKLLSFLALLLTHCL